jgi:predicted nuclease of predicted toxin-antitoxin system
MPAGLAETLAQFGHDTDTIPSENLSGAQDDAVWRAAQSGQRLLITQDLDFSDLRQFAPGTHAGILLVRLREPTRQLLIDRVATLFRSTTVEDWAGCFVVATDHKLRIRRPGSDAVD